MTNAERIKQFRDQQNMSIRTMSARLGVAPSFISDLESGNRDVSPQFADKAARLLELDLHIHKWVCACGAEK